MIRTNKDVNELKKVQDKESSNKKLLESIANKYREALQRLADK